MQFLEASQAKSNYSKSLIPLMAANFVPGTSEYVPVNFCFSGMLSTLQTSI